MLKSGLAQVVAEAPGYFQQRDGVVRSGPQGFFLAPRSHKALAAL